MKNNHLQEILQISKHNSLSFLYAFLFVYIKNMSLENVYQNVKHFNTNEWNVKSLIQTRTSLDLKNKYETWKKCKIKI